jgi:acetyl-CoA carboxylase biotin carboxyl carrier protein
MELKDIKELVKLIDKSNLTEFEYENEDIRLYLSKNKEIVTTQNIQAAPVQQFAPQQVVEQSSVREETSPVESTSGIEIKSPIVGTFYAAPAPDAAPYVKVGDIVSKGDTLCIVEAMKIMNEIEAEFDCKILKILGVNAKPVEFGEVLFIVEKV